MRPQVRTQIALYYRRLGTKGCQHLHDYVLMLLLLPLSYVYGLIGSLRVWFYQTGILRSYRAHVPVVSVGNLAVGGTGKTPVVDWLLEFLHQRGYRVAVISRGYASSPADGERSSRARKVVTKVAGSRAKAAVQFGDEPVLLASRHPHALVVVAPRRIDGVRYIQEQHQVDIIVLDDGFQHLALKRDLDLVLLDAQLPFGNGHVLPAGLMRERRSALKRADLLLLTRHCATSPEFDPQDKPLVRVEYTLAQHGVAMDGSTVALDELKCLKLGAFAGIANPDDFFASLHKYGIYPAATVACADHVPYTPERVGHILERCADVDALITTEKDAVKLEPGLLPVPCYYIPLVIHPLNGQPLIAAVQDVLDSQKSRASA
ncbi:MAG: tetraacyldisaccharide 4'-kinase [Desulfuromonas sp.]|nr:tetraacyldisaccharide 4'-kinase [Desulfuromonas sp.]